MADHTDNTPEHLITGKEGEKMALQFLKDIGMRILEQNWRSGHKEIDIIAEDEGELVIVEVKTRKSVGGERLEEHFTTRKQLRLIWAAATYLSFKKLDMEVRFDIILLTGEKGDYQLMHIESAFSAWDFY